MRKPIHASTRSVHNRRLGPPHRYRPVVKRSTGSSNAALRVALAPVLIVALMVVMWAIAFELERRARLPHFAAIQEAIEQQRYDKALEMLNDARPRTLADEVRMRKARLRCLLGLGSYDRAMAQLRWLTVHDAGNASAYHMRLGDLLVELGDPTTAQEHYRKAAQLDQPHEGEAP